jgi:hypothetical protein
MTYEEDQEVLTKFPLTQAQEDGPRAAWPWVPGYIIRECGDTEWEVCITDPRLAREDDDGEQWFPYLLPGQQRASAKDETSRQTGQTSSSSE